MTDRGDNNDPPSTVMRMVGKSAGGFAGMALGAQAADYAMEKLFGMPSEPVTMLGAAALGAYSGMTLGGKDPYKASLVLGGAVVAYAAREHMQGRVADLKHELEHSFNRALEEHGLPYVASVPTGNVASVPYPNWDEGHHSSNSPHASVNDVSDVSHADTDSGIVSS